MTNFDYVQMTIDIFEASLATDVVYTNSAALAARIGYSTHHLGRLFHSLCGESLGRYILRRRLSEAVLAIRSGQLNATEAAARYGWEDYSAFGRAVRREFGVSPSLLPQLDAGNLVLSVRARPRIPDPQRPVMHPGELIMTKAVHVTGLVFFMGPNEKSFHKPWQIFMHNRQHICSVIGEDSWQFSSWDNAAVPEDDGLWIHCALRTQAGVRQDLRFFSREIPAMQVLRFIHTGPIESIHDSYRRIFQEYLPASAFHLAGNMEFQHYRPDGSISICLPVR